MPDEIRDTLVRMLPRLRRFGIALTGSRTDADELVQDTCERAMRNERQLRDSARIDAWLYGIMRNRWTDELRSKRLRRHAGLDAAADAAVDGERLVDARMNLADVRTALATLPSEQRTVLTLVCIDGLSYREAADIMGVAIGTVMSRLSRGRRDLDAALDGSTGADAPNVYPLAPKGQPCRR